MKMKKILFLMMMLLLALSIMMVLPNKVFANEMSDEYKKLLNEDGKLVIDSIKPSNEDEFISVFELLVLKDGMSYSNIANDFSSCDLTFNNETHTVEIAYNYNKNIKSKLNGLVKNFPSNVSYFKVQDMELINYWANTTKDGEDTFTYYSGELKSYLNNYNVSFQVDNRAGMDGYLLTERIGIFLVKYNGITYYMNSTLGARGEHIIYVPTTTGDSKEELMAAAQKRIDEYIGKDKMKLSYSGTAYDIWLQQEYEETRDMWKEADPNMTFEQWKDYGNVFIPTYNNFEEAINIKGVTEADSVFSITVGGKKHFIIVKKDNSKMITPSYRTTDIETDVMISSSDSAIPLDTNIQAKQLTNGSEYNKIIKSLNVKESAMFDLKLYSSSLENYVTKTDEGIFEVKIPVPDNLKGKELVVYYTDDSGKTETFEVEVKDGYAIFKTKHFSIYTLAEIVLEENNDGGNDENTTNNSNDKSDSTDNNNLNSANNVNNPKTGDNIIITELIFIIATAGLIIIKRINKTEINNKL